MLGRGEDFMFPGLARGPRRGGPRGCRAPGARPARERRAVGAGRPAAEAQRVNVTAMEEAALASGQAQAFIRGAQEECL